MARKPRDTARWCEQHRRRECAKLTKTRKTCHNSAIEGLDACRLHCGKKTDAAKADGQANLIRQRFRDVDPDAYVDPGDVLAWAVTVAWVDVVDYRMQLKDRAAKPGTEGAAPVSADELDRLMRMETDVARMGKMAVDAGVEERRIRMAEQIAEQLVSVLRGVVTELGHNPADPKVAGVVQRHLQLVRKQAS